MEKWEERVNLWPESPTHYKIWLCKFSFVKRRPLLISTQQQSTHPQATAWTQSSKKKKKTTKKPKMSKRPVQLLHPWHLRFRVKSHFNCSGFTCCSHSSAPAIVNHTPFSPKVLDTPTSHNSNLELESAVAPAGPLTCFIHRASDGVIQKAVIFSPNSLLRKQWPCRIWWFTIPADYPFQPSCHFLLEKNILGMPGERGGKGSTVI